MTTLADPPPAAPPLPQAAGAAPFSGTARRAFLILTAVLAIAPWIGLYPVFLMKALCFALFACAFNLLIGFAGLLSFGHAMFLGTAGYVSAHAAREWGLPPEVAILLGTAAAAVLGAVTGALAIRRQGIYFAMITLALAQMIFFFYLQAPFTHGEDGIQSVPRGHLLGVIDLSSTPDMYYLVLVLFLGDIRSSLIVSANLVLTPLLTFLVMNQIGLSANLMSLGGLAIAIGLMVDGSVVVVENIFARLSHARHDHQAGDIHAKLHVVLSAVKEVATPVLFGVTIIILVFLPLMTLEGMEGKLFAPLAYTIAIALAISLVLSLTLSPVLSSYLQRAGRKRTPGWCASCADLMKLY